MGIAALPGIERKKWVKRTREGDATGASAGANILTVETDYQCKLTRLEIQSDRDDFFNLIVRDQDGSNPVTRNSFRIPSGGGEAHRKGTFDDPIMNWGAKREITIQNTVSAGATEKQQASITLWELNP